MVGQTLLEADGARRPDSPRVGRDIRHEAPVPISCPSRPAHGIPDIALLAQHRLDFAELDAEPTNLDLMVARPMNSSAPSFLIRRGRHPRAGAIQLFGQRARTEPLGGQLRIVQ